MMDWQSKIEDVRGGAVFTIVSMISVYFIIAIGWTLMGKGSPPSWAGMVAFVGGIASGGVRFIYEYHKKTLIEARQS